QRQGRGGSVGDVDYQGVAEVAPGRAAVVVAKAAVFVSHSSSARVRGDERHGVACLQRRLRVAMDLIAVDRGQDMPVQGQPELLGGRTDGGGPDPPRPTDAALDGQHAVALDDDIGRGPVTCRAVVVGGVDVEHRVQFGVHTGQPDVGEQRGLVKLAYVDFLEKVR